MEELRNQSTLIDFVANTQQRNPPEEYVVFYHCTSLIGPDKRSDNHEVYFYLNADYPAVPPMTRIRTPIFHPNMMAPIDRPDVQEYYESWMARANTEEERQKVLNDMQQKLVLLGHICLDTLQLNWSPSLTLATVVIEIGEMLQYKRINVRDPLNYAAVEWVAAHRNQLPIDRRALLDLKALDDIRILDNDIAFVPHKEDDNLNITILL